MIIVNCVTVATLLQRVMNQIDFFTKRTTKKMDVKLATRSAAKSEQGIIDYNLAVPHRILIKFETEHYERGSFVSF